MGHHFVPQRYLKGFQSPEKQAYIWAFDKKDQTAKHLPIKQVSQAPGFYENDIETSLNLDVEIPGYNVIEKILRGEAISDEPTDGDRQHLSYYIATMIRRVPRARTNAQQFVPQTIREVTRDVKQQIVEAAKVGLIDEATLNARLAEADAFELKAQTNTPEAIRKTIETPWPFESMLIAIHNMQWRILRCQGPSFYLTSDNPAYFFEGFGLGHAEAELILPLSTNLLLHCSWQDAKGRAFQVVPERLVKELNRRIASGAERFVYYFKDADWVLKAAMNQPEQLSRINWA